MALLKVRGAPDPYTVDTTTLRVLLFIRCVIDFVAKPPDDALDPDRSMAFCSLNCKKSYWEPSLAATRWTIQITRSMTPSVTGFELPDGTLAKFLRTHLCVTNQQNWDPA